MPIKKYGEKKKKGDKLDKKIIEKAIMDKYKKMMKK